MIAPHRQPARPSCASESGFSLIELLVALSISVLVLMMGLTLFDVNTRISRVQGSLADMQQAHRVGQQELSRMVRMAGRGGLPVQWAIAVQDNVDLGGGGGGGSTMVNGEDVRDGSDILTLRGVFNSPVYVVDTNNQANYNYNDANDVGTVVLTSQTPGVGGVFQTLEPLADAATNGGNVRPEALVLVSALSDRFYAVAQLTSVNYVASDIDGDGNTDAGEGTATITFSGNPATGPHNASYLAMSSTPGTVPQQVRDAVVFVGILEEYQYFVRDGDEVAEGFAPKLSQVRLFPGTAALHSGGVDDIADNIIDLQVVRAFDRNGNGQIDENPADHTDDDWLNNDPGDNAGDPQWIGRDLLNVRITTIARTDRPDRGYVSAPLTTVENHSYAESPVPTNDTQVIERSFRRRVMSTVIDIRNFS